MYGHDHGNEDILHKFIWRHLTDTLLDKEGST